jgi:hypothetical protein
LNLSFLSNTWRSGLFVLRAQHILTRHSHLPFFITTNLPSLPSSPFPDFQTLLRLSRYTNRTTSLSLSHSVIMPKAAKAATNAATKTSTKATKAKMPKSSAKATTKTKGRGVEKKKKGTLPPQVAFTLHSHTDLELDPNAPKRGLSAYMFFANEQRESVREENPGISFGTLTPTFCQLDQADRLPGQVGKVLGDRWKALNEKQRGPYETRAQADKKRYEDEKAKYNVS